MINVSENFKTAMKQPVKEIQAFIDYDENVISDSDDLISFKISCDSGLCKTAMRKLEAQFLGNHALLGKLVKVGFGVRLPDGDFDFINYGTFLVTEFTTSKDTETSSIVAYDLMVNAMTPYVNLNIEYPIGLYDYTKLLCEACGLELKNEIFGTNLLSWDSNIAVNGTTYINSSSIIDTRKNKTFYFTGTLLNLVNSGVLRVMGFVDYPTVEGAVAGAYTRLSNVDASGIINVDDTCNYIVISCNMSVDNNTLEDELQNLELVKKDFMLVVGNEKADYSPYNSMNDWQITQELWENIEGITYRDIFVQIAQATGSTCIIHDDKVYFKPLTNTNELLTYDNMFKLKLENVYGEINSVVLSRTPIVGEDVYLKDEASVETNGLTEFKIENNEIIDKDRENAITPIFEVLNGISYYPFEATTEGLGWYEIGDNITIIEVTDDGLEREFKTSLFNYSITVDGSIKETLKATAETKTQTQYQYATTLTKRVKNAEIIVNKQEGNIQSLITDVREEDGIVNREFTKVYQDISKIEYSVQNSGGNNLIQNSVMFACDDENKPVGWDVTGDGSIVIDSNTESVSQHGFTLLNKTATTRVAVLVSSEKNPVYYSFSTKIKKSATGECGVKIYNTNEEYIIPLGVGESADYNEYVKQKMEPKESYYIIEFYSSPDCEATFTDNMFAMGEYKSQWTQANGETMNTNVVINKDGITVKTLDEDGNQTGDYTVVSTVEFAGYSYVNGTKTKVFSLNKDITRVSKLFAENEITMPPIKVVPVTTGDIQGWAFVPYVEEGN